MEENMNYLWALMILTGVVCAAFNGTLPALTNAALESAKEAVTLCIAMTGVMSFWMGLMRIAEKSGIIGGLSRRMRPILRFFFPGIPADHAANEYIATNMIANIFGLGWAATPAGLKAMEALAKLEAERGNPEYLEAEPGDWNGPPKKKMMAGAAGAAARSGRSASSEMCTFLIINISSLQLIPVNIIACRGQYGSVNPTAIVGPALMATTCSTLAAVLFCKIMEIGQRGWKSGKKHC